MEKIHDTEKQNKLVHFLYCPVTGLGLYQGMRGNRWLRNRITIFKQFVVPSLQAQTSQNFTLWVSWRYEDRSNSQVKELEAYLQGLFNVVFTYSGVCFWDDKYPDDVARTRLVDAVHGSLGVLIDVVGEAETVLMTIQPSDDCYCREFVERVQDAFEKNPGMEALGFKSGYVMDYTQKKLAEWNPTTIPPFSTIKFSRETFTHPLEHVDYTGPYKSHEYIADKLKFGFMDKRGFLVGVHGENISTVFNHPFTGRHFTEEETGVILKEFGLESAPILKLPISIRKKIMRKLPHKVQRKVRYIFGERFYALIYEFLRS